MTREKAKELLPILQAYAEGKTIQIYNLIIHDWVDDTEHSDLQFTLDSSQYRIKPEDFIKE